MKTYPAKFPVRLAATEDAPSKIIGEVEIELYKDANGIECITPESQKKIEDYKVRYLGIMTGADIKALRKRLNLTQDQLSELISCGKKSLSRWENGKGFPTGSINKLLRLIDEGKVSLESLHSVTGVREEQQKKDDFYDLSKALTTKTPSSTFPSNVISIWNNTSPDSTGTYA